MYEIKLGTIFKTTKDIITRDGVVKKGTLAEIGEVSNCEYNPDGVLTPYKIYFENADYSPYEDGSGNDWLTENEVQNIMN